MAWAVHAQSLQPVHISFIPRDKTGLACECVCPGCGATLQAVNAGRPASDFRSLGGNRTRAARPHFRHHTVQQRSSCRTSTARQVALHLLATTDEIELPAPKVQGHFIGASGAGYEGVASSLGVRSTIIGRTQVDRHSAVLHLANGKTIAVVLVADAYPSGVGNVDGVICIEGDDPDLADMDPAEVLQHIRLDGEWLRWVRHWDDDLLAQQAQEDARRNAEDAIDLLPDGLVLPEGLSPLQRSESVLHWALKEALAKMSVLDVPGRRDEVRLLDHEGMVRKRVWSVPDTRLHLKNIRLEARMGNLVPDIVCSAVSKPGGLSHTALIIEIAVTHKVDQFKLAKIVEAGYACIEFDATRLATGGRVRRSDLPLLISDRACIRWLHHPAFVTLADEATKHVQQQIETAKRLAMQAQEQATFFQTSKPEVLYDALWACLQLEWQEGRNTLVHFRSVRLDSASVIQHLALQKKGFTFEPGLMERGGVLQQLAAWSNPSRRVLPPGKPLMLLQQFLSRELQYSKFITVLFAAIKAGIIVLDEQNLDEQKRSLQSIRRTVWDSLNAGRSEFARPGRYDDFLCRAFPVLKPHLKEEGTDQFASMRASELVAQAFRTSRAEQERILKHRSAQNEIDEKRLAQERCTQLIREVARGGWEPAFGHPHDVEQALHIVRTLKCQHVNRNAVIQMAWAARAKGWTVVQFYESLNLVSERAIREVSAVLNLAFIKL